MEEKRMKRELTEKEISYLSSLPSMDEDENFWKCCGECPQGIIKHVEYKECARCNHLCFETLAKKIELENSEDTQLEVDETLDEINEEETKDMFKRLYGEKGDSEYEKYIAGSVLP